MVYYWTFFLANWTDSLQTRFPRYLRRLQRAISSCLSNHNYHVIQVRDLPEEYIEAFKQQSYRVENFAYHLRSKINSLMSKYVYALRNISSTSRDLLVRRMNDLYTDAVEQKGTASINLSSEEHKMKETWLIADLRLQAKEDSRNRRLLWRGPLNSSETVCSRASGEISTNNSETRGTHSSMESRRQTKRYKRASRLWNCLLQTRFTAPRLPKVRREKLNAEAGKFASKLQRSWMNGAPSGKHFEKRYLIFR